MKTKLTGILVLTIALSGVSACTTGGCVWTESSDLTVLPATPCLELTTPTAEDSCVNPEIVGVNQCTEAFVVDAAWTEDGTTLTVAPGDSFVLEPSMDMADDSNGAYAFEIPATVGTEAITISFTIE